MNFIEFKELFFSDELVPYELEYRKVIIGKLEKIIG